MLLRKIFATLLVLCPYVFTGDASAQTQNAPIPKEALGRFASIYYLLRDNLPQTYSGEDLINAAIKGMLKEVDPENGKFDAGGSSGLGLAADNYSGGSTGLELVSINNTVTVVSTRIDSPAEKAGFRARDVLTAVNGVPLHASVHDAIQLLRGPVGSSVTLTISRKDNPNFLNVNVTRELVKGGFLRVSTPASDVALLKIVRFGETTLKDLSSALLLQWKKQAFKGVVLDLRQNSGGPLSSAVGVAALFLPSNSLIAETRGRTITRLVADPNVYGGGNDPFADLPMEIRRLPLVVLVDEGTANGAEMVAAALRSYARASIVGRQTLGKTSVLTFYPLAQNHSVTFTTSHWFPPSNENLDRVGIAPDRLAPDNDPAAALRLAISELKSRMP